MKIKTLVKFSGVPKDATGIAEKDEELWKITWDEEFVPWKFRGIPFQKRPLEDWFSQKEFDKYLEVI